MSTDFYNFSSERVKKEIKALQDRIDKLQFFLDQEEALFREFSVEEGSILSKESPIEEHNNTQYMSYADHCMAYLKKNEGKEVTNLAIKNGLESSGVRFENDAMRTVASALSYLKRKNQITSRGRGRWIYIEKNNEENPIFSSSTEHLMLS